MLKDYLRLHILIIILSFTGILGKLMEANAVAVVSYRTFVAAVALFIILKIRGVSLKVNSKDFFLLVFTGMVLGLHWLCFFGSAKVSTVSISLVTFSTTSFFTSLLEPIFLKKKFNLPEIVLGILAIIGVAIMFSFEIKYFEGIIIGLMGAFLAAVFSIINSKLTHRFESQVITFYEISAAFLVCILVYFAFFRNESMEISSKDWIWLLILSLGCTVIPHAQMIKLMKKLSVFTVNLSLNMEPIYGVVLAFLIFGESERMSPQFYFGGLLVLMSVFLHPFLGRILKRI
jgi:drug/metabolite transporter (DMT)-like permease